MSANQKSAELKFHTLEFEEKEENSAISVRLMRLFEFGIGKKELERIGKYKTGKNSISFEDVTEEKAEKEFNKLISKNIINLRNRLTGRKAVYIHRNSGIPLFGILYFGIVDKGSDMIEVKPITGCNIECVFCSVGEGLHSKKAADYVVEDDYIAEELERLLEFKRQHENNLKMKIFINPHGEPLLYSNIVPLVGKISKLKGVGTVSIITNGTLLSEKLIDELKDAGLTQLNISINSLNKEKSRMLSGISSYDSVRIKKLVEYAAKKLKVVIAPVWIKGMNDDDIEDILSFAKENNCEVGIQKFMSHPGGKKPAKEASWDDFYGKIAGWEGKYGLNLRYCEEIAKTKELPSPFKRDEVIRAKVACEGRRNNERIAVARERCMLVFGCEKNPGAEIKIRIKTAKHNIFTGEEI